MDCPECGQQFSIVTGNTIHGKRVRRPRTCVVCRAEWSTVEITVTEHASLIKAQAQSEEVRQQVAGLWKENGA